MGKSTGFMEYVRESIPYCPPLKRIRNWDEFYIMHPEEKQRTQAARCMDCGTPFCHSGIVYNGAASGCPLNNLIPEWNDFIYKGLWKEAYQRLKMTNNFPEFTGRVCPALCEGACTLGINQPQVTIKNNEFSIIERAYEEGWVKPNPPKKRTGFKVAVVGSGPSGLACAAELNKLGHNVTVFERFDRPGGLLMYGIPNMKLDKKIVMRRINLMEQEGIEFRCNSDVGRNISVEDIKKEFNAIVLCCGASNPRDLKAEGRELDGIHFAVEFLRKNTKRLLDKNEDESAYITAKDKNVIVVGGGDTGTDCVATSIRQGCKSVVQIEIMPQMPETRQPNNPWPQWPRILKTDYGQEECIAVFGKDPRIYNTMIKKIVGTDGKISKVHTVNVDWVKNDKGQFIPKEVEGSEKILDADLILIAMGFVGAENYLTDQLGIEHDNRTNVKADYVSFMTNSEGIFAAGDMRRGQSLVVWAINEGRAVAKACNEYLNKLKL